MLQTLPCPPVGHHQFEKSLSCITIGDADTPQQISKFVRPYSSAFDNLGMKFKPGELQKTDLVAAHIMFSYPAFIANTFRNNIDLFQHSQCRIYQFQTIPRSGKPFIFGLFITDGSHNLVDFCVDEPQSIKRRAVLMRLIRAVCTPGSVARKLSH
jgi:hypothetical protein